MLLYLSKKIAIPNQVNLNCISWNRDQGWIACGGDGGLLKVLKLEVASGPDSKLKGIAAPSNLSMNQTLEGHTGRVMCATWNPLFRKLTTSDENGLIIVWMLHKGMWYEEMINNRNKSVVRDMKWTPDGRKICIIYEDGAVIVGSVDGNRLWGKELSHQLRFVEWSPDSKLILFITPEADVYVYDADGVKLRPMALAAQKNDTFGESPVAAIHWFHPEGGKHSSSSSGSNPSIDAPTNLCIAFENGLLQLSRGDEDQNPIIVNTELNITSCGWNNKGTILAVTGTLRASVNGSTAARKDRDRGAKDSGDISEEKESSRNRGSSDAKGKSGGGGANSSDPNEDSVDQDRSLTTRDRSATANDASSKQSNVIKFYDAYGRFLRCVKIPGEKVASMTWEGSGLRIALAVDSFIFFANIRPAYNWAYLLNTVVYSFTRSVDRRESSVVFWDLTTQEAHVKHISNLKFLSAAGDYCAVVYGEKVDSNMISSSASNSSSKAESKDSQPSASNLSNSVKEIYVIQLRNAIGAVIDTKRINFTPKYVCMGQFYFAAANDRIVYTWQFQSQVVKAGFASSVNVFAASDDVSNGDGASSSSSSSSHLTGKSRERMFDIESINVASAQTPETFKIFTESIGDPISCITITDKFLVVARKSGCLIRFSLPHLAQESVYNVPNTEPYHIEMNCTSSKCAMIDANGVMSVLDLEARVAKDDTSPREGDEAGGSSNSNSANNKFVAIGSHFGKKLAVEKRDVWDCKWADDNADMLCFMEKTKMCILTVDSSTNGSIVFDEPVVSSGYLARFKDLEVRVVTLDELLSHPEQPNRECVIDFETQSLRNARDTIQMKGLAVGYASVEKNSHPRLWKLLAHCALDELDLAMAERSFVRCGDYFGIQLVKQLRTMPDKMKAKAEIAMFFQRYDEAEAIYREIDRKDLAVQSRRRVGDYVRVVQLLQTGGGNDKQVREALDMIGDYYVDRFKWKKAAQYFAQSRNLEKLAECYYRLESFSELSALRSEVPEGSPMLTVLGNMFASVGLHTEASDCYVRAGNPKAAVDCCVSLNKWSTAIELAEQHGFPQIEGLLTKYANSLQSKGRYLEAVELFRIANKPHEAAMLTAEMADQAARRDVKPIFAKKLHVLAALEVERHRKRTIDLQTQATLNNGGDNNTLAQATAATLDTLMMATLDTQAAGAHTQVGRKKSKAFASAWHGAAAYHYYMLAQRQFYSGQLEAAMKTAIKCCDYYDILSPRDIYSLLALTSLKNKFFGICSKAFVKLETLHNLSDQDRDEIQTLAVKIFVQNAPVDPAELPSVYLKCLELGKSYKACVISGRAIQESAAYMCRTCRHNMLEHERVMTGTQHCPLCHTPLPTAAGSSSSGVAPTLGAPPAGLGGGVGGVGGQVGGIGKGAHNINNSIIASLNVMDSAAVGIGFGAKK